MFKKFMNGPIIVGADIGKTLVKIASDDVFTFSSKLYPHRELNLKNEYGEFDFEIEYKGQKYLGGDLGEREGEVALFNSDTSKNHEETLIVLLCALSTFPSDEFLVVMGSPVINQREKKTMIEKFKGTHEITINGVKKRLTIKELEIAPEGAAAFWTYPNDGIVRVLDFGSTTVNYATLKNRRYIDKESGTFPIGISTMKTELADTVRGIISNLKNSWNPQDQVYVVGGGGVEGIHYVKEYLPNAILLDNYLTATAEGFKLLAEVLYEEKITT